VYNEDEWDREWQYIVSLTTWQPKNQSNAVNAVSNNRYNVLNLILLLGILLAGLLSYVLKRKAAAKIKN